MSRKRSPRCTSLDERIDCGLIDDTSKSGSAQQAKDVAADNDAGSPDETANAEDAVTPRSWLLSLGQLCAVLGDGCVAYTDIEPTVYEWRLNTRHGCKVPPVIRVSALNVGVWSGTLL